MSERSGVGGEGFELLSDANALLLAGADPEALIQTIAERVLRHLACDVFFNYVWDEDAGRLHLNAYAGVDSQLAADIEWLDKGVAICGCVAELGQRIVSEDVQHNGDPRASLVRSMGVQAYSCQPLEVGGETVGTLSFGTTKKPVFSEDELDFMLSIAKQLSIAMERSRRQQALAAAADRQAFLLTLSDRLRSITDPQEVRAAAARMLAERLAADRAWYVDLRPDGSFSIAGRDYHREPLESIAGLYQQADFVETRRGIATGEPFSVSDTEEALSERTRRSYATFGVRSFVSIPMMRESEPGWGLTVASATPRKWTADEIALVREVSERTWESVHRAMLYEAEHERAESQRLLLEAAQVLAASVDMGEVLARVADIALRLTSVSRVFVNLIDLEHEVLIPVVPGTLVEPGPGPIPFKKLTETSRRAIEAKATTILDFELPETPEYDRSIAAANDSRLVLFVPLVFESEIVGHIALDEPGSRHAFTTREIDLVEGIASQAAIAVKNARAFEHEREAARYADALNRIGDSIHSSLEIDEIMRRVVEEAVAALNVDAVVVEVREGDEWPMRYAHGVRAGMIGRSLTPGATVSRAVYKAGSLVMVPDVTQDPVLEEEIAGRLRAFIGVPLLLRGEMFGVLIFMQLDEPRRFTRVERDFAMRLATSVSLALGNSRLYATEHDIAETLQETLVVLPKSVPGVSFSRAYESATYMSGRVGGDFVDVFEVHGHLVGITLGDVSGKGIDAAVTTSLVRTTLRVHALDGLPPALVAGKANQVMRRFSETESFVTVWFGLLDTKTGHLRYVCAGHPPALVLGADGALVTLECRDPILGAFEEAAFFECQAVLSTGDRLILYTDGVTEARDREGGFFEMDGLCDAVRRHASEKTADFSQAILDAVTEFSQGELRDDAAVLTVEPVRLRTH